MSRSTSVGNEFVFPRDSTRQFALKALILLSAIDCLAGCSRWVVADRETLAATLTDGEEKVRLTDSMSNETVMKATHATADTIYGRVQTTSTDYYGREKKRFGTKIRAIPLMEVERIEVRQGDPVKTGAAVGAIPCALFGAGLAGFFAAGVASIDGQEEDDAAVGMVTLIGGIAGAAVGGLLGAGVATTISRRDEPQLSDETMAPPTTTASRRPARGGVGLQGAYGWFLESGSTVGAAGGRFDFLVQITQNFCVGPELAMYFPGNTTGPSWSVHGITRGQTRWRFPLYVYGGLGYYQWDVPDDPPFGPNDAEFIGYCLAAGLHSGHRPAALAGEVRLDSGFSRQRWNTVISASLGILLRW